MNEGLQNKTAHFKHELKGSFKQLYRILVKAYENEQNARKQQSKFRAKKSCNQENFLHTNYVQEHFKNGPRLKSMC